MTRFRARVLTNLTTVALITGLAVFAIRHQTAPPDSTTAQDSPQRRAFDLNVWFERQGLAMDVPTDWAVIPRANWDAFREPFPFSGGDAFGRTRIVLADDPDPRKATAIVMFIHVGILDGSLDFARSLESVLTHGGTVKTPAESVQLNGIKGAVLTTSETIPVFGTPVPATLRLVALDLPEYGFYMFSYSADGTPAAVELNTMMESIRPAP